MTVMTLKFRMICRNWAIGNSGQLTLHVVELSGVQGAAPLGRGSVWEVWSSPDLRSDENTDTFICTVVKADGARCHSQKVANLVRSHDKLVHEPSTRCYFPCIFRRDLQIHFRSTMFASTRAIYRCWCSGTPVALRVFWPIIIFTLNIDHSM